MQLCIFRLRCSLEENLLHFGEVSATVLSVRIEPWPIWTVIYSHIIRDEGQCLTFFCTQLLVYFAASDVPSHCHTTCTYICTYIPVLYTVCTIVMYCVLGGFHGTKLHPFEPLKPYYILLMKISQRIVSTVVCMLHCSVVYCAAVVADECTWVCISVVQLNQLLD